MPIQQKVPPPVLLFSNFAGWEAVFIVCTSKHIQYTLFLLIFVKLIDGAKEDNENYYKQSTSFKKKLATHNFSQYVFERWFRREDFLVSDFSS